MGEGNWDDICDVLVAGSGGGALIGAYAAGSRGLKTIVVEATDKFGGTTAYSGSGMWHPGNPVLKRSGAPDDPVAARAYYKAVVGGRTPEALQDAYLDTGPKMIEELERNPNFRFEVYPWPDYYGNAAHAHPEGRHIISQTIPAEALGELRQHIRPTLSTEREGQKPADALMGGQALIGRALLANQDTGNVELRRNSPLVGLIVEDGVVVGGEVDVDGKRRRIRARRGVLLAAGGFEQNNALRKKYGIAGPNTWSVGGLGNHGQALEAAIAIGAATDLMDQAWWSPGFMHPDGTATFTVGILGGIMVNGAGKRFANESMAYDRLGREMLKGEKTGVRHIPSWMIWDKRFAEPPVMNASVTLRPEAEYIAAGLWKKSDTLEGLAEQIGVPADALKETIARFNGFAETGVDEDFRRGEEPFEKFVFAAAEYLENLVSNEGKMAKGPAEKGINPGLTPISEPPFYAAQIAVSDLGTKGGLKTDTNARVLRPDGSVIPGLYAAGNTMAAVSGEAYPGGGNPVGSSAVFSYLAALDMTRA
ncbi:MAG TPA: FAD-binding protein [Alphaproteobacteria bacterium]|nr:FAD-binding protein [Alphaproteobacteria bacterium]